MTRGFWLKTPSHFAMLRSGTARLILALVAAAKIVAHWVAFAPPLMLAAVIAAGLLDLSGATLLRVEIGLEQAMEVHDDIFHLGIVDGALRGGAPRLFGRGVIGKDTDHVELGRVDKVERLRILHASAENEMQLAHTSLLGKGLPQGL